MPPVAPGGRVGPPSSSPVNTCARAVPGRASRWRSPLPAGLRGAGPPPPRPCLAVPCLHTRSRTARRCLLALSGSASPLPLSVRRHSEPRTVPSPNAEGRGEGGEPGAGASPGLIAPAVAEPSPSPGALPGAGSRRPAQRPRELGPPGRGRPGVASPSPDGRRGAPAPAARPEWKGAAGQLRLFSQLCFCLAPPRLSSLLLLSLPGVSGGCKAPVWAKLTTCLCAKLTGGRTSTQTLPMASRPLRWRPRSPAPAPCRLQPRPTPTRVAPAPRSTPDLPGPGFSGPWEPGQGAWGERTQPLPPWAARREGGSRLRAPSAAPGSWTVRLRPRMSAPRVPGAAEAAE